MIKEIIKKWKNCTGADFVQFKVGKDGTLYVKTPEPEKLLESKICFAEYESMLKTMGVERIQVIQATSIWLALGFEFA